MWMPIGMWCTSLTTCTASSERNRFFRPRHLPRANDFIMIRSVCLACVCPLSRGFAATPFGQLCRICRSPVGQSPRPANGAAAGIAPRLHLPPAAACAQFPQRGSQVPFPSGIRKWSREAVFPVLSMCFLLTTSRSHTGTGLGERKTQGIDPCVLSFFYSFPGSSQTIAAPRISTAPRTVSGVSGSCSSSAESSTATTGSM